MKSRRRRSLAARGDWRRRHGVPLLGQVWERADRPVRRGPRAAQVLVGLLVALELALVGWLLRSPAFGARHLEVRGATHVSTTQVRSAAGLGGDPSVFSLDGDSVRRKLAQMPWIRTAKVEVRAPDRVLVALEEWQPMATYRAGPGGQPFFINDQASLMGPASPDAGLLEIEGPAQPNPKPGQRALDLQLLTALVNIQRGFPGLVPGQQVRGYQLDGCGSLVLVSKRGWKAYFGRVLTPEEFSSLNVKLTTLSSYAAKNDLNVLQATQSLNLMGVTTLAVNAPPTPPPTPSPRPSGASPAPTPSPSPKPTPGIQVVQPCR